MDLRSFLILHGVHDEAQYNFEAEARFHESTWSIYLKDNMFDPGAILGMFSWGRDANKWNSLSTEWKKSLKEPKEKFNDQASAWEQ